MYKDSKFTKIADSFAPFLEDSSLDDENIPCRLSWPICKNSGLPKFATVSGKLNDVLCKDSTCQSHYNQIIESEVVKSIKERTKQVSEAIEN